MIEIINENEETEIIGGTIPVQAFATNIEVTPGISSYIGETDPIFKASPAFNITNSDIINWNSKQDKLTAGENITIENNVISSTATGGTSNYNELENKPKINNVELSGNKSLTDLGIDLSTKQDTLVSGTNIKTINNNSILGSGNINIEAPVYSAGAGIYIDNQSEISVKLGQGLFIDSNAAIRLNNDTLNKLESIATKQDILESGTNIKTINNESILGSGNLEIGGGDTLPIGAIVDYDGGTVPEGYEIVANPTYSTSETKTGETWIDGKPIYRKVFISNSNAQDISIPIGTTIDALVTLRGYYQKIGDNRFLLGGSYHQGNLEYLSVLRVDQSNRIEIHLGSWIDRSGMHNTTVILEYTKTTD